MHALAVLLASLAAALAAGLGALPFLARRVRTNAGTANAVAAGMMLAASAALAAQGAVRSVGEAALGAAAGVLLVLGARAAAAATPMLLVGVMTVHSGAEGVAVGSSFAGAASLGIVVAVALAVHKVPEGLAVGLVLVPRGARVRTAALWAVLSSLPLPLLALPAYVSVERAHGILPAGLGFAAGAMTTVALAELLPDALEAATRRRVGTVLALAFAAMAAAQGLFL